MSIRRSASCIIMRRLGTLFEVFILQRCAKRDIGKWEFPVGKIDSDETFRQGMVRELFEESGVQAHPDELKLILRNVTPGATGELWWHSQYAILLNNTHAHPSVMEPEVHNAGRWVSEHELYQVVRDGSITPQCINAIKEIASVGLLHYIASAD